MKAARRILDSVVGAACCLILALMIVVLAWQVFSRYALNTPSTFSEEILRYGMIWSSFLGAAYACSRGTHMAVGLVRDMAKGRLAYLLHLLVPISFLIFSVTVLIVGGLRAMDIASGQYSAVLQIPMVWVYAAMPVGGAFMVVYSILNLLERLFETREEADPLEKAMASGD
ncbi:TRAP transporter small permease [Tropicimonas marinistellae]|uniref:TRAP transporter small permease n=1 Tax=Tropicimonas marinistellae TaxID=1739787 RepID=UPI000836DA11|nr:TRAP transporter small permease [Tropicimonas marinistellae]